MKIRKKIILGMLVLGGLTTGITQAWTGINNCYESNGTQECYQADAFELFSYKQNYNKVTSTANFWNENSETIKEIFSIDLTSYYGYHYITSLYWNNGTLKLIDDSNYLNTVRLYQIDNVCKYNGTDIAGITNKCGYTAQGTSCYQKDNTYDESLTGRKTDAMNSSIQSILYLPYGETNGGGNFFPTMNGAGALCMIYTDTTYCVNMQTTTETCPDKTVIANGQTNVGNGISYYENEFSNSPFIGGNGGGGNTTGSTTSGATLYCPPIQYEISMYGNKFNTGLCYSNTEEISGGQVTTVTPISIFEAFPTYQNYVQAYNLITNNCHTSTVNTQEQCQEALQGIGKKPAQILLKLINSNIQEGVQLSKIYQYCHLQLDFTEEEKREKSTCDLKEEGTYYASGVNNKTQSNPNPLQGMTDALQDNTEIVIPEDGTIFDEILPDGIISWKDVIFDFNFRTHLTKLITKMFMLFQVRPAQTGILPPLITSLLLLVILFKIYKK